MIVIKIFKAFFDNMSKNKSHNVKYAFNTGLKVPADLAKRAKETKEISLSELEEL